MRKIIYTVFVFVIAVGLATPASAFQFGLQFDNNGNAAVIFGFPYNQNSQGNYYGEPRPRNQDQGGNNNYQPHQPNRWQRPDTRLAPDPIECTRNISYDRRLGYVDQRTGRPCL